MNNGIALKNFRRSDTKEQVKAGQLIFGDSNYISDLYRLGLIKAPENRARVAPEIKADPLKAAGRKSSASLVAQASQSSKSKKPKTGGKQAKTEASL